MKIKKLIIILLPLALAWVADTNVFAQRKKKMQQALTDSISVSGENTIMLNAANSNSTGPREVNIGLPGGVTGTSVNENGLPVNYFNWPMWPIYVWRLDDMTNRFETYDIYKNAIKTGEVGVAVSTHDNMGTDMLMGNVTLKSNHFGLLHSTGNISGPLNKNGLQFSAGYYLNYDPGTLDMPFKEYYSDQTKMFKGALTQKYRKGKISLMYKYIDRHSLSSGGMPFYYNKDGTIDEIPGIKIGKHSFYEKTGKVFLKDIYTGEVSEKDIFDSNFSKVHELYVLGENKFGKGWTLNYAAKGNHSVMSMFYGANLGPAGSTDGYVYRDNPATEVYGDQKYLRMYTITPEMTLKTLSAFANMNKKTVNNELDLGVQLQLYNPGTYSCMNSMFYTNIQHDPQIIYDPNNAAFDEHGTLLYNGSVEYYSGKERKYSMYVYDNWDISKKLNVKLGARLEMQTVNGFYAPQYAADGSELAVTARKPDGTFSTNRSDYMAIDEKKLNFVFNGEFVYKLINPFGFVGGIGVTREAPHLESYGGKYVTNPKPTVTSYAQLGFYYNNPFVELVSKATYIKKKNNLRRDTFTHDLDDGTTETANIVMYYGLETIGWTTDFLFTPFYFANNSSKSFKLHFLFTLQAPKYNNYEINPQFASGYAASYNYNDKTITSVSKMLMEIDPSYTMKLGKETQGRIWLSGRYYGKQYANLPNTLYYAAHWETFGGISVKYKNLEFLANFTNLLNQKGITGTIGGTDLKTQEEIDAMFENGNRPIYASSAYIRPFTAEFGFKYKF